MAGKIVTVFMSSFEILQQRVLKPNRWAHFARSEKDIPDFDRYESGTFSKITSSEG